MPVSRIHQRRSVHAKASVALSGSLQAELPSGYIISSYYKAVNAVINKKGGHSTAL